MKKITGILCFMQVFLSMQLMAQSLHKDTCHYTLYGKVVDGETHEPLPGATIVIKELNKGAIADENGEFSIRFLCHDEYSLECYSLGYKSVHSSLHIFRNTFKNFILHSDTCMMQSVEIDIPEHEIENTLPSFSLKGKELDQRRGLSLGEALKGIPGVSSLQTGPSIFKPVIQGMYGNRVLILNNGVRQEGQQWGSEHAPEIDPFIASDLTVVRGASSVQYGSDAIGGVILVNPEELRRAPGLGGEVSLIGFSNNRQGVVSGKLDYAPAKLKGVSLRGQGTLKQAGNSKTPEYYMKNTGFKEYNFSWAAGYKGEKLSAEIFYSQFNSVIGIFSASHIGNLTDLQTAIRSPVPLETSGFTYEIDRPYQEAEHELTKLSADYRFENAGKLKVTVARQYNYRSEFDKHRPFNNALADKPQVEFKITTHTGNVSFEHLSIGGVKGIIGVDVIRQGNTTGGTAKSFIPNFESNAVGAYLIERWKKNRLELEAGARYDYKWMKVYRYENNILVSPEFTFSNFSGVLGGIYSFNDHWKTRVNAGTAFRPVAVSELFSEGLHHGSSRLEYGDKNLVSEYAYNSSLSLNYQYSKVYGEIHLYNNYIQNFIYLAPGLVFDPAVNDYVPEYALTIRGAFPVFRYKQVDALFSGVDATFNDSLSENFIFSSRLSLLRAYNVNAKEHIILIPPASFEYGLKYQFRLSEKITGSFVRLNHLLVARKNKVPSNQDVAPPPPAYMLFSLEGGCTLFAGRQSVDVSVSVYNLLNNRYRDYMDRFRYFTDAVGRNIVVRVKVPFNSKPTK